MSKVFRAKYVAMLREKQVGDTDLIESLFKNEWVVYGKRPFGGPQQVIEYLGRYTHKVAISNHRIEEVDENNTTFSYKDYRLGGAKKQLVLSNQEFIRRFSQHILPIRFVRIRHYGIISSTWKRGRLQQLQEKLLVRKTEQRRTPKLYKCACCKTGTMVTIEFFGKRGPPQKYLVEPQSAPVA